MARLRIATWNVNSVRSHMEVVARFVAEEAPDLLCLQETKVADEQFPLAELRRMGFAHQAIFGQKAYHGVAVFSAKLPLERIEKRRWCGIEDAGAEIENALTGLSIEQHGGQHRHLFLDLVQSGSKLPAVANAVAARQFERTGAPADRLMGEVQQATDTSWDRRLLRLASALGMAHYPPGRIP